MNKRIDILDYLRGFALLGIILINIIFLLLVKVPEPHSLDAAYQRFLFFFIEGRFYTIFSFLFGVGYYLFISRANEKGKNGTILFLRRIGVMFLFGVVHFMFHPGEALTVYAISGLLILPFYKVKKEVNLIIGLALLMMFAIFSVKILMPLALILLGLTAGQYQVFERITRKKAAIFTGVMFVLSIMFLFYQSQFTPIAPFELFTDDEEATLFMSVGITIGPIISAFYVGLLVWLLQYSIVQKLLSPLKSYGRMALTNYIGQTALILIVGNSFDLIGRIEYLQTFFICAVIYVIQLIFSVIWLRYFKFGPLEWVWRMITYLEILPMKR